MSAAVVYHHSVSIFYVHLIIFAILSSTFTSAVLVPPSFVQWQHDRDAAIPALQSGRIQIEWSPATGGSIDHYKVEVTPLDYTDTLQNPLSSGFVLDNGDSRNSISYNSNGLQITTHAGHNLDDDGRNSYPIAFRKIPVGAYFEVTTTCSGLSSLPNWFCGANVFNGATNSTLLQFGLSSVNNNIALRVYTSTNGNTPIAISSTATDSSSWTSATANIYRITRNGTGTRDWLLSARKITSSDTPDSWTNITLFANTLTSVQDGDLWYGMSAVGWGGSVTATASTLFTSFRTVMPIPSVLPRDLNNAVDLCVDPVLGIRKISVIVPSTEVRANIRGLSGFFPYTLSVIAIEAGTNLPFPSEPLPGIYFYPRRMPPRNHMLGLWLDGRYLPGGAIARWPDASMRGHDLTQADPNRRPSVSAGNVYQTATPNFRRSNAQHLVSGADVYDLGIAGNFTAYIMLRGTTSTPQVIFGRGGPATTITGDTTDPSPSHVGWAAVIYNELYFPYPGYLGLKVADGYSPTAGAKKVHWIPNVGGYNWYGSVPVYALGATVLPRDNPSNNPLIPPTGLFLSAVRDNDATLLTPGIADAWGDNTTGVAGMAYVNTPNGTLSLPPSSPSNVFRVGGPAVAGGDTLRSFDGDLWQVLLYRENHDTATRTSVQSWLQNYVFGDQCTQNIMTPNTDMSGQCGGQYGYGALRCHQTCKGGFQWFMGTWHDHWCQNGVWTGAPLLCKKGCGDAIPPLYVATCRRSIVADDFSSSSTRLMYITYPSISNVHADNVWSYVNETYTGGSGGAWLQAHPEFSDPCARMNAGPSVLGIHNNRWNDIYLPWGSKAWMALSVMLETVNSTAGMAIRLTDVNNHYRVSISSLTGITLTRISGGRAVNIGNNRLVQFDIGVWYDLLAVYERTTISIIMNNVTLLNVNDPGGPSWGSVGMFADGGPARFRNMSINSTCDLFNQARNMAAGMRVSYECKPGYETVGNTTWTCGNDGTYGTAKLVCKSFPPIFGNYSFSIEEHSPNGTTIGVAYARPANPEQLLTYSLVAQYPYNASYGFAFQVVSCSGAIRIYDPYQFDYQMNRQFNVTIMAVPDGQTIAAAYTNVTINIINVVDPPMLLPTVVYINETLTGAVSGPIDVFNPDKFTLKYTIGAGDSSSRFTLDPDTGLLFVKPPGLLYAENPQFDLLINAQAQEDLTLTTNAVLTLVVVDINTPPVLSDEVFYIPEGMVTKNTFIGIIPFSDPDVVAEWNQIIVSITKNVVDPLATANPLFRIDNSTGALFFEGTKTYSTGDAVYWFGDRKARDIFELDITACDNGGQCTIAKSTVVVLAVNVTDLSSLITGISSPAGGMKTDGGEIIRFLGKDFPPGAVVTAQYTSSVLGVTFMATGCFVKDFGTIQCTSAPGYGASLTWKVFINAFQVPTTTTLVSSYAPPVIYSIDVNSVGFSTAGSALAAVTIKGENFGPSNAPVTVTYGSTLYSFTVPTLNSVSHSTIKATLGPGCGTDLPVTVTVARQASSNLPGVTPVISYPPPTISSISLPNGVSYSLSSLPTTDSVDIILEGTNFGPDIVNALPLVGQATYSGPSVGSAYTYSVNCRKDDTLRAHTRALCRLSPGVGYDMGWTLDICGQVSSVAPVRTSYAPPSLARISGPGANRASTEGGQNVILDGANFGPLCCDLSNPLTIGWVRYGNPGKLQYTAVGCRVISIVPPQISCLTGPGTGRDHVWQMEVGGQTSTILVANTSYSPPVIYNFIGAADAADTRGYENVTIVGSHFGSSYDPLLVTVTYTDLIQSSSDFSGDLPGTPPGSMTYTPKWCTMTVPHKQLTCGLQPGAGTGINWVVVVDNQVSTAPTTAYGIPVISSLSLLGGKTTASTDGGDVLDIQGSNFGLPSLLQRISFGPTGTEYRITSNLSIATHTTLRVTLGPAIPLGSPMRFQITVADQVSELSTASLSLATPSITSVTPTTADGEIDPLRPTTITIKGTDFGLLDTTADVAIAFGNAGDNSFLPLIAPSSRSPTVDEVTSLSWIRPASPIPQTLTFPLPPGLGKDRAIRVVPYRRGQPPSLATVAALPSQGVVATFSYIDPFVDYIVVSPATTPEEQSFALTLFGGSINGTDISQLRRLEIRGRYFGPAQDINKDAVLRIVEEQTGASTSSVAFRVANWTHRLVTVYTYRSSATIRVRIVSKSQTNTDMTQVSGYSSYSDVSPSVDGIVGTSDGFATIGGGIVTFKAGGLGSCVQLNVTVGGRRCTLLDSPTGQPVDESDARTKIIVAQGTPPFPANFQWTISCVVPEGQGTAAIVIIRDGVKSADGITIRYAPPTILRVGTWDETNLAYATVPFVPGVTAVTVATESWGIRTVRLEGDNFGTCPSVLVATDTPTFIDACIETQDPYTGAPIITPNPTVRHTHSFIEFVAPDGEGTGMDVSPPRGWTFSLSAGGQSAQGIGLFRYSPPIVYSISPSTGPTRGHTAPSPQVLTIAVKNIGKRTPVIHLGSLTRTWMPCNNVVRVSNLTLTCELPEGSGVLLHARVTVADLAGMGGEFNYTQPTIASIRLATVVTNPITNVSTYNPTGPSIVPMNGPSAPYLTLPTVPDSDQVIVIDGDSFGPWDPSDNCVFVTWYDRKNYQWSVTAATPPTTGPLVCVGNQEDYLGEGQISDSDVLEYGHSRIVFRAPRGAGQREITLRAGGQAPPGFTSYANLIYPAPTITGELIRLTELSTDGGGRSRIPAINIPRRPFSTVFGGGITIGNDTSPVLSYPFPLPLPNDAQAPSEHIIVHFGARCLTSAGDISPRRPPGTETCIPDSILSVTPSPLSSLGELTFLVPPGVGANKSISVGIISNGIEIATSNIGSFSYDPPIITRVEPSPVYQRLDIPRTYLIISGKNFGRLADMKDWPPEEQTISVYISNVECLDAIRIIRLGVDAIQCQMTLGVPVGHRNVTVIVGGQPGTVPERDTRGIFIVCSQGLYGMVGESCSECPRGASCPGFIPNEQIVIDAGVNVTENAIRNGRIQYDIGGIHNYPVPNPGFFNLNGSMGESCPPGMLIPGRDLCIVPCMPSTSCLADNICAEAYTSKPPMYRCASCAKGFYRRNGECERCPQNSAAQFIILLFMAMVAAAVAYWMNRFNINPAFISIGLDYFQVIAIFAQSKIPWPAVIKDVFYILSAFNLNLEILAPECFLPEVTFSNKFAAIISMPIIVYLLFAVVHGTFVVYKRCLKRQEWRKVNSHLPGIISASLLLLYIFYLYVTKTILDVFNCVPTEPPDGRLYLAAVFEQCYLPGGAHLTLLPYAIFAVILYTIGYPVFLGQLLHRRRELVMEDQYLRAKNTGDDRLNNPHAYTFRRTFSRVYYQFKPEYYYWILAIIVRKFCIAFTSLMFGRNVGFQMASCLMILFLAYAAQVRYSPYMSPDEQDDVIRKLLTLSATSPLHNRLRATLAHVESLGRKRGRTNKLLARSKFAAVSAIYYLAGLLFNYNFVDATLLFSACIVNLCGLLYQAARPEDTFYSASRDGITGVVLTVIALSVLYWVIVVVVDVASQFRTRVEEAAQGRARERLMRKKAKTKKKLVDEGAKLTTKLPHNVFTRGIGAKDTIEVTVSNPMFLKKDTGSAIVTVDQAHSAIMEMDTPPDQLIWDMFRNTYTEQFNQIKALGEQLSTAKAENTKLQETIENAGLSGLLFDSSRVVLDNYRAKEVKPGRRQFGQIAVGGEHIKGKNRSTESGNEDQNDEQDEDDGGVDLNDMWGNKGDDNENNKGNKHLSMRGSMRLNFSLSNLLSGNEEESVDGKGSTGSGSNNNNNISKRGSVRIGSLFGLGGNPLSSSSGQMDMASATAAAVQSIQEQKRSQVAKEGGWRSSLRMTGFNLKNVSSMVDNNNSNASGVGLLSPTTTIPPVRSSIFGSGSVLKSNSSFPTIDTESIQLGNPLARNNSGSGMVSSPLAVNRNGASSTRLLSPSSSSGTGTTTTPNDASGPTGRGNRKRLAGKVVVKESTGNSNDDDGNIMMSSPMNNTPGNRKSVTGNALKGFHEKYSAVLDD